MKRARMIRVTLFGVLVTGLGLAGVVPSAAALGSNTSQRLALIKDRASAEVDRRLAKLNQLDTVMSADARLTPASKMALTEQVSAEISGLTAQKAKVLADTDVDTARIDAQAIVTSYRVYALILPKIWMVRAADDQLAVEDKLNTLGGKLQTRINEAQSKGHDVTALQSALNELQSKTQAAQTLSALVEQKTLPLQPTDYNNDHTLLSGYREQLKTAHADIITAAADAKAVVQGLKGL